MRHLTVSLFLFFFSLSIRLNWLKILCQASANCSAATLIPCGAVRLHSFDFGRLLSGRKTSRPRNVISIAVPGQWGFILISAQADVFSSKFILVAVKVFLSERFTSSHYKVGETVLLTQWMFFPPATGFAVLHHVVRCCVVIR